ncbi:solute carrier family 13 member 5 [Strongylocentrotus purpuratus]|uniref:Solute carrier family 13 member 5 n=1 Tax=Strongylocentrotus purpuratus TaxID=7668 RepID=A0A7M7SWG9_STRPU|nr:solute carrier family 13 member 5 [Strongylocentrotus purpuratus]
MGKERGLAFQEVLKNWQYLVIVLVPIIFCWVPIVFNDSIGHMAYCIIIMALYWMTECLPLAATALLPILLFPLFGIQKSSDVCSNYLTDTNTVFFGGLMVAAAVEHWNLHKRIALRVLMLVGAKPRWLMFGFMSTTAFLSMWMSNTATTAMMIPISQAVLDELKSSENDEETGGDVDKNDENGSPMYKGSEEKEEQCSEKPIELDEIAAGHIVVEPGSLPVEIKNAPLLLEEESKADRGYRLLCKGITLSIPYAANIGGTATLTGTGPNLVISTQVETLFGPEAGVNFGTWMMYAFPGMVICLLICWVWLQIMYLDFFCLQRSDKRVGVAQEERAKMVIRRSYAALGKISFAEWAILGHFVVLVSLWLTRDPKFVSGWSVGFKNGYVTDATSVIFISLLLFAFPSRLPSFLCRRKQDDDDGSEDKKPAKIPTLLTWSVIHEKMAWSVIILLGGGSALADGCKVSGLSAWLGAQFSVFSALPPAALAIIISTVVATFTEVTSNTATATIFLPIFAELSKSIGLNPLYLMLPAAIACSFAFMLPVATPPNAIAFAHGNLSVFDMVKAGIVMNIACIFVSNLSLNTLGVWVFDVKTFPAWANSTVT